MDLERVFISNRELLILDEPTVSLDRKSIDILETFIRNEKSKKVILTIFTKMN